MPLSDGAVLRPHGKDLTIIICHNKPPDRKGIERPSEGIEWVVDVVSGRDDPDNLRILKRRVVEVRPLKSAVGFSDLIKTNRFISRPAEMS